MGRRWIILFAAAAIMTAASAFNAKGVADLPSGPAKAPPDVEMVVAAIALRLRDLEIVGGVESKVIFSRQAKRDFPVPKISLRQFRLAASEVTGLKNFSGPPEEVEVEGNLVFSDGVGRRAFMGYRATYMLSGKDLLVTEALAVPLTPPKPAVDLFFVPAEAIRRETLAAFDVNTDAIEYIASKSVQLKSGKIPKGRRDYYVAAVFLDRLPPGGKVGIEVGAAASGPFRAPPKTIAYNHAGWRIVMIRGAFEINGPKEAFFKIVRTPMSANAQVSEAPVTVALYSTRISSD